MEDNSIIPQSDDRLIPFFLKEIFLGGMTGPTKDRNEDKTMLLILGLILVVGTEPFKLLLRKNIGKLSISIFRVVLSAILYFIWAGIILVIIIENKEYSEDYTGLVYFWFLPSTLWAGFIFYIVLGISVLIIGLKERARASANYKKDPRLNYILQHVYRGDSIFFSRQLKKGASREKIWLVKEPVFCLIITVFISVLNIFTGLPLVASSISFWFNEWFQVNNVWEVTTKKIRKAQYRNEIRGPEGFKNEEYFSIES